MILIVLLVSMACTLIDSYSREDIRKYYPWYQTDQVLFPDENNQPIIGYLAMDNRSRIHTYMGFMGFNKYDVESHVKFEYFSRQSPDHGIPIKKKSDLSKYVNISKPTKIVTHGWMSSGKKDSCVQIKNGFLKRYDANVIIMDWSDISKNPIYPTSMMETPTVGKHYGTYLNYLVDKVGVNPHDIHLVGHSLGAHVSGFAGREVKKGKIGRITGLDPALPGFGIGLISSGTLNKNDATFVDVIHTCAGFLGYKLPLGHADFYPNGGGPPQPGCSMIQFLEACSHGRSWKIFATTLISGPIMATECSTLDEIATQKCNGQQVPIGDSTPFNARGIYYAQVLDKNVIYSAHVFK